MNHLIQKAYTLRNYHLLVAVLAGLDSHWVQRALKQTQTKKPGIWENRMIRDLRQWSTNQSHFKHIRNAVDALAEIRHQSTESSQPGADGQTATSRGRAASEGKPPPLPSCVPFFGVYSASLIIDIFADILDARNLLV
jgi:Gdp/GTP exchange factor required for growth at low temperatures